MVMRTGDNTRLEVTRSSVVKVVQESAEKSSETDFLSLFARLVSLDSDRV